MTDQHPHTQTAQEALDLLKQLSDNLTHWDFVREDQGIKRYHKDNSSYPPLPMVRGETVVEGHEFTTEQVASVIALPGCRKMWDVKVESIEIKVMYHVHKYLFWCGFRANFPRNRKPYYPRDMAGIALREVSDVESFVVMTSVQDNAIPNTTCNVRAHLNLSGWRITKLEAGIRIIYITQIDLNGYLPKGWLDYTAWYLASCAGKVAFYLEQHGYPPTITECTVSLRHEEFDHQTKEYCCTLEGSGCIQWIISGKMYPNHIHISVDGNHGNLEVIAHPDNSKNHIVLLRDVVGPIGIKMTSK